MGSMRSRSPACSLFAEPVIPDELRFAERDPESSESSMTSFGVWFPAFAGTLSGSRLASAPADLAGMTNCDTVYCDWLKRWWAWYMKVLIAASLPGWIVESHETSK